MAAELAGAVRYQGRNCTRGHGGERYTSTGQCTGCTAERQDSWRKRNPEQRAAQDLRYRTSNPERYYAAKVRWRKRNSERHREIQKRANERYRAKNATRVTQESADSVDNSSTV